MCSAETTVSGTAKVVNISFVCEEDIFANALHDELDVTCMPYLCFSQPLFNSDFRLTKTMYIYTFRTICDKIDTSMDSFEFRK